MSVTTLIQAPSSGDQPDGVPTGEILALHEVALWGVRSKGGIVTIAPDKATAEKWADYEFKASIGACGEKMVVNSLGGGWAEVESA